MTEPYARDPYQATAQPAANTFNVLSIVAFVLSLLGTSIIAVVLGHIALSQIKRTGQQGRGFGIAALIIGYVSLVATIVIVIAVIAISVTTYNLSY